MRVSRRFRRIVAAGLLLTIVAPATARYSGGTGEPNDPYQIATATDLIALGETPEDYDKHLILTADIDLDPNLPGRKVFDRAVIAPAYSIGVDPYMEGTAFSGVLDGKEHKISHLTVKGTGYLGLFGQLGYPARISDLGLEAVEVSGTAPYVGGLVGWNYRGSIVSSYSTGTVSGIFDVGGLIGYNEWGHITDTYSSAVVNGEYSVGGLVGEDRMGSISSSYSTGRVSGDSTVGGLVGDSKGGSIVWSYSTGSVSGTGREVGGLVGSYYWGLITTSYSTGAVSGDSLVGGLVGGTNGSCKIVSSYSVSSVGGTSDVGGLVGISSGWYSSIDSSYSSGRVSGTVDVGGLVGRTMAVDPYAEDRHPSFWDSEASGQTTSAGGILTTTAEMQDIQTFLGAGWDFETVWMMPEKDYPHLERRGPEVPDSSDWVPLSSMKMARNRFAGGAIGNEIFVFGGGGMGARNLYSGEKYDIATDTWSDIADNPHYQHPHEPWLGLGVEEVSGIGCNGKFYVFGAYGGYEDPGGDYGVFNYNEMYDPATDTWTTLAKKPTTKISIPVVYKGKIYLFGGDAYTEALNEHTDYTMVEAYDPETGEWERVTYMPKELFNTAIAVHKDVAYLIAGYDYREDRMSDEVMTYSFQTDTWTRNYCTAPPDAARAYSCVTQTPVVNGKAYLIGGFEGESSENYWRSDGCAIFDIESKTWESAPALPKPRDSHLTVISNNTIYVIGGEGDLYNNNKKDTVFAYTLPGSPDL